VATTRSAGQREAIEGSAAQGFPPVDPRLMSEFGPGADRRHARAFDDTFLDGIQLTATIGAAAMAIMIVFALFVRQGEKREGAVAVHV